MGEYVRPEMLRDLMPRETPEGDKPKAESSDSERISGVYPKAEAKAPPASETAAKALAEQELEKAFFSRGESMGAAHEAGQTIPKNAAERRGDENAEMAAMRQEAARLKSEIDPLQAQVAQAEEMLKRTGVNDPTEALAKKATTGLWGRIKNVFSRKPVEGTLLGSYDLMSKQLSEKRSRLNELENRLNNPAAVQNAMRIKAERK